MPEPEPGPFEALVKIEACGLCGTTDRHIIEGHLPYHPADQYPALLGHESVGTVVKVGAKVGKFRIGDRVTRPVAIWPGTQRAGYYSAWGGFAEYGLVRDCTAPGAPAPDFHSARQHIVPPSFSIEDAVAAISIAEVASWMGKLGPLRDAHVVIGGTGFAACLMCQCARASGARSIITLGRTPSKFAWATKNGATHTLLLNQDTQANVRAITDGLGAHWFLDAAGHQAVFEQGLTCLRPGGHAAIYGAPDGCSYRLPLDAVGGEFDVRLIHTADDTFFDEACRRMADRRLDADAVRTHVWHGLESLPEALADQIAGKVLKGLVRIA
ncbi:MAG: zinc-binding dehydrogenase [Opitutaceae bacterium]|nr:zinc-binding dehydrogenase [Opitutaceae bacterium]